MEHFLIWLLQSAILLGAILYGANKLKPNYNEIKESENVNLNSR